MKVIKAIQEHHHSMKYFDECLDEYVQVMIDECLKPKTDLRSLIIPKEERKQVLREQEAFQPDGLVDPDAFHFGHTELSYARYISKLEKEHAVSECRKLYKAKMKPFLHLPNLN